MSSDPSTTAACPYCGLTDHTGREHMQFVTALSPPTRRARVERAIRRAKRPGKWGQ